ncbi:MAG: ABC transporter permease [Acidobacteria bacterium]|nr:ABC transporter permease [Acidobacteriota bacterium]
MKAIRLWAVARKEFLHIIRDPRSLGMALAIPILLLILFGYALTMDVDRVPLVIWDQSGTPASREFLSRFVGSRYFSLQEYVLGYGELERAIDSRNALVALVVPSDFAGRLDAGRPATVQMIVDGSDSTTATLAMGYAESTAETYSRQISLRQMRRITTRAPDPPLDLRPRVWFNADLESKNYIVPGLIAVILMVIAALLTSLAVAREWERGTMEQLISTPVQVRELVLGKLLPYLVVGFLDALLAILMSTWVFHVPLRGSIALLLVVITIFLVAAMALGMLVSIVSRSQLLASQMAMILTFLPGFLLSGFVYEISSMPKAVQIVTYVVPARYFVSLLRGIYLKGTGLNELAGEVFLLILFGAVILTVALQKFKKKLE